ncbi:aggregation factor core [Thalassobaculum salexigens]|uniref:aggregation factor core n=1 Tax=Thalassobaculum salexigens TaxID=455360 RepID=UPI0012EB5159|nr:aggregation factor core [Thalassobaculum salexigens]
MRLFLSLCLLVLPGTALADACGPRLVATFSEGAPADRFTLTNTSDPGWSVTEVEIDLGPSRGRVIFDVTERGAGLSVYQPFEEATGTEVIADRSDVTDGDSLLTLRFSRFAPGDSFGFTIDLDDTAGFVPTVVSTDEIAEGRVRVRFTSDRGEATREGYFDDNSEADTGRLEGCFVS